LSAVLAPDVAEKILDAYWGRNGEIPKLFTIDLAFRFFAIAKETKCLDDAACERLDEMWQDLEQHRQGGLTDKNLALIRQVLTSGVWGRVVKLPLAMMATARSQQEHQPVRAAVMAQLAVAIAILTFAPVRLANLAAIKLGFNLIKPGGPTRTTGSSSRITTSRTASNWNTRSNSTSRDSSTTTFMTSGPPCCGAGTRTGCSRDNITGPKTKSRLAARSLHASTARRGCG
jgi:hypothetical protein